MFNTEYLNPWREIFLALEYGLRRKKWPNSSGRVLIVNVCIIGEFAASLPAIADFIGRHPRAKVDLIVAPSLKKIAEKIRGVNRVFTATSSYFREEPIADRERIQGETYEEVIILRLSREVINLLNKQKINKAKLAPLRLPIFGFGLLVTMIFRRRPKQWREFNFEMLGGTSRIIPFDQIFVLEQKDYQAIDSLVPESPVSGKILIHTSANWQTRVWKLDRWVELLKRVNDYGQFEFIFIGAKVDEKAFKYIAPKLGFPVRSLISRTDLLELLLLMRRADCFIGIDSGPANLAHLSGLRSATIYGPGPHLYLPVSPDDVIFDKTNGRGVVQMFFASKRRLVDKISVDEVYNGFRKLMTTSTGINK